MYLSPPQGLHQRSLKRVIRRKDGYPSTLAPFQID